MKKFIPLVIMLILCAYTLLAQVDARMLRQPDVSETHITFVYGGDIWLVAKDGGLATKLSSPKGSESFPRFSPDGEHIAFTGNYDGNGDIYIIPTMGGLPKRITHHGGTDKLLDWYPDGDKLLYASFMNSGRQRFRQLYKVSADGGLAEKLPIPYGEFGSISEDGKWLAYTKRTRTHRTWKRYRGGTAPDIWLFNLQSMESMKITDNDANNEIPMWHSDKVYYLSDNTPQKRFNIFVYNIDTKERKQITQFEDYDIHYPAIGPKDIVFEAGGTLYLLDLATEKTRKVEVDVVTDKITLQQRNEKVDNLVQGANPSPDGKRVVVEARGELFSVPAEHGPVMNLTNSSGTNERYPDWSPNGKFIAYWSDASGEYELYVMNMETNSTKKVSKLGKGYRYRIYWAPDSKKLAFIDQSMTISVFNVDKEKVMKAGKALFMFEGALRGFEPSWSSDSKWLAYSRELYNQNNAIFIYDTDADKIHQVTSGYYSDMSPEFDPDGKYLYYLTNRNLSPVYSDLDNTFIYPNATQIAAASLRSDVSSPLAPRNDMVEIKKEESAKKEDDKKDEADKKKDKKKDDGVKIDFTGFEDRVVILPPAAGNISTLEATNGKLLFHRIPNSGSADKNRPIMYFDFEEREEKTVVDDASWYEVTDDGKKVLVRDGRSWAVVDLKSGQKLDKKLRLSEMEITVDPVAEWKQIFNDVWRMERDMFYDPNMHGVDWDEMRERYGKLIDYAVNRDDVNYILGELIAELNASHTYRGGGDYNESPERRNVGYLGIDWAVEKGMYKIDKIVNGAPWDVEVRSPLALPDVDANEGDYVLAVNGMKLKIDKDPYAAFQGLAGKIVELTLKDAKGDTNKTVLVELMNSEYRLRHLAWIEANRKMVEDATGGKIGYVYVRSTGVDGQTEMIRQFIAQLDKEGLIIDERFNSGGQIPDRFIEMLNRKPLAFWAVRDGRNWRHPSAAIYGPKVMLINGWSGSGGDAFPDYFRKAELGPLVGKRTWGGLIGITGAPTLMDGGSFSIPTFRMYDPDGDWFKEGYGVDPDFEVDDNPTLMAKGKDPQLEKAIDVVMEALKKSKIPKVDKQPKYEKR